MLNIEGEMELNYVGILLTYEALHKERVKRTFSGETI